MYINWAEIECERSCGHQFCLVSCSASEVGFICQTTNETGSFQEFNSRSERASFRTSYHHHLIRVVNSPALQVRLDIYGVHQSFQRFATSVSNFCNLGIRGNKLCRHLQSMLSLRIFRYEVLPPRRTDLVFIANATADKCANPNHRQLAKLCCSVGKDIGLAGQLSILRRTAHLTAQIIARCHQCSMKPWL